LQEDTRSVWRKAGLEGFDSGLWVTGHAMNLCLPGPTTLIKFGYEIVAI
jgi:hypothetical protein